MTDERDPIPSLSFHGSDEAQAKLAAALAIASEAWVNVPRDGQGYHGDYTTIAGMMKHCRPSMAKNGVTLLSPVSNGHEGEHRITVVLMGHGARIEASVDISRASLGKGPQEWGKVLTYLRRYAMQGILGIEGDKDPDQDKPADQVKPTGSPAKPKRKKKAPPRQAPVPSEPDTPPPPAGPMTDEQNGQIRDLLLALGVKNAGAKARMKEWIGHSDVDSVTEPEAATLIAKLSEEVEATGKAGD